MITRIQVLNYRCLEYVDVPLDRFHVMVGPNGSGKSTLIDAVRLLSDLQYGDIDDFLTGHGEDLLASRSRRIEELFFQMQGDRFEIAVELQLPASIRKTHGENSFSHCRYEIAIGLVDEQDVILGENLLLMRNSSLHGNRVEHQAVLFPQVLPPPTTIFAAPPHKKVPAGCKRVISKALASGNDNYSSETTDWHLQLRVGAKRTALGFIPEDERRFPAAIWVRDFLREGLRELSLDSDAMKLPCSPSAGRILEPDGSNLALVVARLMKDDPGKFNKWLDHVRTALPDIKTIRRRVQRADRHLYLAVQYLSGNLIPAWLLSDGTLRMLALTIIPYLALSQGIYLIEEPENGIHPQALESVIQSLSSVYDGQVLLATHSPLIIGLVNLKELLCFRKDARGATAIVGGESHPRLKKWQGEVDLQTLYASGVL
jgi:predicted ATPase